LKECTDKIVEYSLPLFVDPEAGGGGAGSVQGTHNRPDYSSIYSCPATACPPLLIILIDGTSPQSGFYKQICSALMQLVHPDKDADTFKSTRVGIFIMTKGGCLSVFDLTSPGGHLKHVRLEDTPLDRNPNFGGYQTQSTTTYTNGSSSNSSHGTKRTDIPLVDIMDVDQVFAPLDSEYSRSCVDGALRALEDSTIAIHQACQQLDTKCSFDLCSRGESMKNGGGAYLGSTMEYILEFIEEVGYHPGKSGVCLEHHGSKRNHTDCDMADRFTYAGGKLMCFLSGPPDEIGIETLEKKPNDAVLEKPQMRTGRMGTGGFGGSCAVRGKRFDHKNRPQRMDDLEIAPDSDDIEAGGGVHSNEDNSTNDAIPQNQYSLVDDYFIFLGTRCAAAAIGVEMFALIREKNEKEEEVYIGFPLLRLISDRR
jgi:hypothetical protein